MKDRRTGAGRVPGLREWHVHGLIGLLAVLFFRDILLRTSFFWEDFLYQYYAFRTFAATSLASGQLPLWNPYTFNGMPFQADIQSAIFYLPNLLLTPFAGGGTLDYWLVEVSIVLHFALAGSGMYLLARRFGLERWNALFSGVAYAFSGFMVGHLIHQGFIYQAAWFPWIFLAFRNALAGRSLSWAVVSGLLLGHALLAGAPQVTLYIVLFLFAYFLFESWNAYRAGGMKSILRIVPCAAIPIVLALLVTAVQLLPTAELTPLSRRAEISYETAAEGSFAPSQFITLAVPKYFGSSGAGGSNYQGPGAYWQYWETQGYIGVAGLVLALAAIVALRRDAFVLFLGGSIVFAFLYGLGDHFFLHRLFHEFVPGFESFRAPGRMVLWYCFAGSLLAGFGAREVGRAAAERPAFAKRLAALTGALAVLVFIAGQAGLFVGAQAGQSAPAAIEAGKTAAAESLKAAGFLLALAALVLAAGRRAIGAGSFSVLLIVLQFADAHVAGFDQNNGATNPDAYFARTARIAEFFREKGRTEYFRINSREGGAMLLDRNQGMIDRIFLMEGYTPLGLARFNPPMDTWQRTCDLMNAKYRIAVDRGKGSMSMTEAPGYAPRAFVVHRGVVASSEDEARAIISDPGFDPMSLAVFETAPAVLHQDPAPHRSSASIESYGLNEILVTTESDAPGYLVLSEVWYPGWRAEVDGVEAPVLQADWCLRAVPIPAGKHSVAVEFTPGSFRTGAWISSLTLVVAVAGIAYTRKKEKK